MNFVKKIIIFTCYVLAVNSSLCNVDFKKYPELAKFIEKYSCSSDIENKIKENPDDFFLKYDIGRIINAERMKTIIKEKRLDHLSVAQKCLICNKDGLKIISQKVKNKEQDTKISLIEIKQLVALAEETGFRDWVGNVCYDEQGRIAFFDTEDMAFALNDVDVKGMDLPNHCKANYVMSLLDFQEAMEVEAQEWIIQRINELLNSSEGIAEDTPLFENTKYDDPEIDFEQVKKEYEKYKEYKRQIIAKTR